ncbi:MAG TPA: hypothetical protein V6D18_04895 [Thermosynechococcaceae cyanobacterium]
MTTGQVIFQAESVISSPLGTVIEVKVSKCAVMVSQAFGSPSRGGGRAIASLKR